MFKPEIYKLKDKLDHFTIIYSSNMLTGAKS